MERNKGITLVALIITIIIMLILVAVSVNVLIKSDLIGIAEKTTGKYKTASEEEGKGETIEIGGKKYASVDEYLKERGMTTEEIHNWTRTGDNLECKHCNTKLTIGQEIDYTDNGKGTSSISAEKASGYIGETTTGELNENVKLASLSVKGKIKVAAPEAGAVTDNRPKITQTINRDANTKWVVLGIENTDKDINETNETLLITTKKPTTGTIKLYGAAGYNNSIEEINRMCKELYGEEARGMTIEDVNNCLQYTPAGGMYFDKDGNTQTTNNLTTKLNELPTEVWNAIKGSYKTPDGKDTEENFGKVLLNDYWYSASGNETFTDKEKEVIFGNSNGNRYWLASRGVCVLAGRGFTGFGPGGVLGDTVNSSNYLFDSYGVGTGYELSLRAVVPLKSDIPGIVE
jgi:hypothetical protein